MKVAALDLGSNTFLLLIAEIDSPSIKVICDKLTVTRLGQGVGQNGYFHPEALARARQCLNEYRAIIDQEKVDRVVAVATSAARDAKNAEELFAIGRDLKIPIQIIEGDKEAELTFLGSTFDHTFNHGLGQHLVIDIGGGSTEIIVGSAGKIEKGFSMDIGSVRLQERFISKQPVLPDEQKALSNYIDEMFVQHAEQLPDPQVKTINTIKMIAVAGTPTTLAAVDQGMPFEEGRIHGYQLTRSRLQFWLDQFCAMSVEEKQKLPGMDPKRADVILVGTQILIACMDYYSVETLTVSTKGLRYAAALKWKDLCGSVIL